MKMKGTVHVEVSDQSEGRWVTLIRWNEGRYPFTDKPDEEALPDHIEHWLWDGTTWWHMVPAIGAARRESVNVCEAAWLTGLLAL